MREPNFEETVKGLIVKCLVAQDRPAYLDELAGEVVADYTPTYHLQDDFSVCVLTQKVRVEATTVGYTIGQRDEQPWVGVTKRHPDDAKNPFRGKCTALARAVRFLLKKKYDLEFKGE
jgi:hypothetical protein